MRAYGKQGRGRPNLAPPSPASHPSPPSHTVQENPISSVEETQVVPEILEELEANSQKLKEDQESTGDETLELKEERKAIETAHPECKLWVDVLSENRNHTKGLSIQFVAPNLIDTEVEIAIEEDDIASKIKFWGKFPHYICIR